jgi:hypothetical protein
MEDRSRNLGSSKRRPSAPVKGMCASGGIVLVADRQLLVHQLTGLAR